MILSKNKLDCYYCRPYRKVSGWKIERDAKSNSADDYLAWIIRIKVATIIWQSP